MRRRILLLITDLEIGGTPTVVRELAVRLHRPPAVHVEVACLSKWGPVADQIRDAGVNVTALDASRALHLRRTVRRLRDLLATRSIDTVFSFLVHANAVAALASIRLRGVRFLQSIQTTQPEPRWHWRVQGIVHRAAERIVVPSSSVAEVAAGWSHVPAGKLVVIPNAVDPDAFPRSVVPYEDPRPYPVVFIGRLDPVKNVDALADAACRLDGLVHLDVWGEGPARAVVELTLEMWGEGAWERVALCGPTIDPKAVLSKSGLLVLPSTAEGFGLVLIEAMAAGVPIVATNVAGIRDVVQDGKTAVMVDGKYPLGPLVEAMRRVVEDRDLRRRLVENGLAEVRDRFSWDIVLPQYRALLNIPT